MLGDHHAATGSPESTAGTAGHLHFEHLVVEPLAVYGRHFEHKVLVVLYDGSRCTGGRVRSRGLGIADISSDAGSRDAGGHDAQVVRVGLCGACAAEHHCENEEYS